MAYEQLTLFPTNNIQLVNTLKNFIEQIENYENDNENIEKKVICHKSRKELVKVLKLHEF